jgi:hypothetical protein
MLPFLPEANILFNYLSIDILTTPSFPVLNSYLKTNFPFIYLDKQIELFFPSDAATKYYPS